MPRTGARSSRSADAPDAPGIVHNDGCFRGSLAERQLEGEGSGSACPFYDWTVRRSVRPDAISRGLQAALVLSGREQSLV